MFHVQDTLPFDNHWQNKPEKDCITDYKKRSLKLESGRLQLILSCFLELFELFSQTNFLP
jgi:hypothetical protein